MNATKVIMPVLDNWDDEIEDWDSSVSQHFATALAKDTASAPIAKTERKVDMAVKKVRSLGNPYKKYPYFLAGLEGTIARTLFPRSGSPKADLKQHLTIHSSGNTDNYVAIIRNSYIRPMFYVLKSTKYYNPITKTRVPPKTRTERVDPNNGFVTVADQKRVYNLFGFQGHVGPKKIDEDAKRDELLEKLKEILYQTPTLVNLVQNLLSRIDVNIDESDIRGACERLKTSSEYNNKSYQLPERWYHDATWEKLRYVYGEGVFANIGGGDGAISRDMASGIAREWSFAK